MKKIIIIVVTALFFILLYFLLTNVISVPKPKPPLTNKMPKQKGVIIYVDTSMSMRGYFNASSEPGTVIQRFMWTPMLTSLKEVEEFYDESIYFSTFGNIVNEPEKLQTPLLRMFKFNSLNDVNNLFSGTETRFIELLQNELLKDYRCFIIISDGVPSTPESIGQEPMLIPTFRNLINSGIHLWLIGIRSEFNGVVYPETHDEYGNIKLFTYKGRRPIYVWVAAQEKAVGVKIVSKFLKNFNTLSGEDYSNTVKLAELTHIDKPKASLRLNVINMDGILLKEHQDHIELRFANWFNGEVDIPLEINWDREAIPHVKEVSFRIQPHINRVKIINNNHRWLLRVDSRTVSSDINLFLDTTFLIPKWWEEWSVNDDSISKNADKTLYLEPVINKLYMIEEKNLEAGKLIIKIK
ncbi:hypothetical protein HY990_00045 [Candidatus Micrarchaeota archaeon]|nr:hypothetical protein [Candidatus Micrarchaeota archaeon]